MTQPIELRLCILGGSTYHPGGVESYCRRAADALGALPGVRVTTLAADSSNLTLRRVPGLFTGLARLWRRRGEIDTLWLQYSNLPDLLYLLLARLAGLRVVVTPHYGANSRIQRSWLLRSFARTLLNAAHGLGLLFDGQDRDIALPERLHRQGVGTFLPRESLAETSLPPVDDTQPLRLVHSGRLSVGKGSVRMVQLCAALAARGVDFEAQIIGRGDAETMAAIGAAIDANQLHSRVRLVEWMEQANLLVALRRADLLVHLSLLDSYPLIVLEAMAAGTLPVVIDMTGACKMVAQFDGHVVAAPRAVEDAADWIVATGNRAIRSRGAALPDRLRPALAWSVQAQRVADALIALRVTPAGWSPKR